MKFGACTFVIACLIGLSTARISSGGQASTDVLTVGGKAVKMPARGLDRLYWLAGCWHRSTPTSVVEEQWMTPRGKVMLGMGRTVAAEGSSLIEYEQTKIEEKDGKLVFTASPSGQETSSFTSIELTDSLVVFENKEHDYPQRVGYRLTADGKLAAWIDGTSNGKQRRVDFPYERVVCPGGSVK